MALLGNLTGSSQFFSDDLFYNGAVATSVRIDKPSTAYLSKSVSTGDSRTKSTYAWWMKRASDSTAAGTSLPAEVFCFGGSGGGGSQSSARITLEADKINIAQEDNNSTTWEVITTQLLRDFSAWYHCVVVIDTTQSTAADRVKIYINGNKVTSFSTASYPSEDYSSRFGLSGTNRIGVGEASGSPWSASYFNGYFADMYYLDGVVVSDSSSVISEFGEFKNNIWIPKEYTGSFGTNGFHFKFDQTGVGTASTSTIGADSSGNTNHYTSSGIVADDCSILDSPENNFCTLNPLIPIPNGTISEGNLEYVRGSEANHGSVGASFTIPTTGKWYWEVRSGSSANNEAIGVANILDHTPQLPAQGNEIGSRAGDYIYRSNAQKVSGGSSSSYGASFSASDVIGVAWSSDDGTITFYKNNASQGTAYSSITQVEGKFVPAISQAETSSETPFNFGQESSFTAHKTAQGNTDANGIGDFYYAPPSGYLALCTANLPEPTIGPNSDTQAGDYFNTVLYTGNGGTQSITGVGHKPDWVWIKERSSTSSHALYDSSRGALKQLETNNLDGESTASSMLTSFDSDGFSVGSSGAINQSSQTYVAWNWKANGGVTSSVDAGSGSNISNGTANHATVQANQDAGFSIVTTTLTVRSTAVATIPHGLGSTPHFILAKQYDTANIWSIYHQNIPSNSLMLGGSYGDDAMNSSSNFSSVGSTTFGHQTNSISNNANENHIFYCFKEIEGYSKISRYYPNNSTDSAFVYTGFKPAMVILKGAEINNQEWGILDNKRPGYNSVYFLQPQSTAVETTGNILDFLSNGFKIRETGGIGYLTSQYIYMAFAETPFKYANAG